MKILAISIAPIFKDYVHGGSQRIFLDIMQYISKTHQIKTLCTKRIDNNKSFEFNENFEVHPILPFRQFFPFPYMTNPLNLVKIIRIIEKESKWADCIYIHADGYLLKNFLSRDLPIITSYHDLVYPITLSSVFLGFFDKVIIPSKYLYECFKYSVGYIYEDVMQRVELINNGIDENIFFRDESRINEFKAKLGIKVDEKIILFPHRPEISKGIKEAIELLERLLKTKIKVRLLFPEYIDCKCNEEIKKDYHFLKQELLNKGILDNVSFFDWISYNEMRHIYSLADITLNLGNFVEAFGLVPLESLLCQTPVICTKAGSLRYNLPKNLNGIEIFDYGDKEGIFQGVLKLLNFSNMSFIGTISYIKKNFNYNLMLNKYKKMFESIFKSSELKKKKYIESKEYILAPWCYLNEKGVYDDYLGDYVNASPLVLSILKKKESINKNEIPEEDEKLIEKNILIPKNI